MAYFEYSGRNHAGEPVEGVLEAADKGAVVSRLVSDGVTPITIEERRAGEGAGGGNRFRLFRRRASIDDLIFFSRQMYALMKAGVPILRAMAGLSETTRNEEMATVLESVSDGLESGRPLSVCLAQHPGVFSSLYVSIIQVGENTGQMDEAFLQMAKYLEQEKDTRNRIRQATRYPKIVIGAIVVAVVIINLLVIPAFARVFSSFHMDLPWATQVLIGTSGFFVSYWPYLLVIVLGGVWGWRRYLETDRGAYWWDRNKLRLPIVGRVIFKATLARFARAFAISFRAGVPLVPALATVARAVDNRYVGEKINGMRNGIERGDSLTRTAAQSGLFTTLILQMLQVGEETGSVDDMLMESAEFYEREVDFDLKYLSDAIEPVLIVAIGVMVLVLALGVFLPMWDLTQIARQGG
ncbi:MAG: type II secretion system F family protein [Gammaproteobacteria bacterium]